MAPLLFPNLTLLVFIGLWELRAHPAEGPRTASIVRGIHCGRA
jgi:hypothetical protein